MLYRPPKPIPEPLPQRMSLWDRVFWALTYALIIADVAMFAVVLFLPR